MSVAAPPAEFLYLDQTAVLAAGVLDMPRAMRVVGEALMALEQGRAVQPHKVVLRDGDAAECEARGRINGLFASLGHPPRALGMKWIASYPANRDRGLPRASALVILNSPDTGLPVALMDGTLLSAMRTGAVTALGVRHLAPRNTRKAAVVGAGVLARTQVLGLLTALPGLEEIAVANRTPAHAEALADECRARWNAPVTVSGNICTALAGAGVVVTITTAGEPVIHARCVPPGSLTVQMSGHECEFEVVSQCSKIVTDDWETVKHRGIMTPALMHARGLLHDRDLHANLGQILLGIKPGRENDRERIHFAHMGMGICDVALAWEISCAACAAGLGQKLRLWDKPLWV